MCRSPSWSPVTPELRAYVAATRAAQGLPQAAMTDPAAVTLSRDPRIQRLTAAIKREVDRSPRLSPEQIERLRGLLPFPHPSAPSGDREVASA
jgi:hypothetical protein